MVDKTTFAPIGHRILHVSPHRIKSLANKYYKKSLETILFLNYYLTAVQNRFYISFQNLIYHVFNWTRTRETEEQINLATKSWNGGFIKSEGKKIAFPLTVLIYTLVSENNSLPSYM